MSNLTTAWGECYAAQGAETGKVCTATISDGSTTYCSDAPALITEVSMDAQYLGGTTAEFGGFTLSIRQGDMANEPPKGTRVSCAAMGDGTSLQVISANLNGGIWYVQVGDIQAA